MGNGNASSLLRSQLERAVAMPLLALAFIVPVGSTPAHATSNEQLAIAPILGFMTPPSWRARIPRAKVGLPTIPVQTQLVVHGSGVANGHSDQTC
jgi:hypothetical protein